MVKLYQTGLTENNRPIIGGVFDLCSTYGIALEDVIEKTKNENSIIDWLEFFIKSVNAGWNPERTIKRLELAVLDSYGLEFFKIWKLKFEKNIEDLLRIIDERKKFS